MNAVAMPPAQPLEALRAIFDAFDRGEPELALRYIDEVYADDIHFKDPLQEVFGKARFMAMNRRFFGRGQKMRVQLHAEMQQGDQIFLAYTLRYRPSFGPWVALEVVTHCRTRGPQIVYHRDYWDLLSSLASSLPGVGELYRRLTAALG